MRIYTITMKDNSTRRMVIIDPKTTAQDEVNKWPDGGDVIEIDEVEE